MSKCNINLSLVLIPYAINHYVVDVESYDDGYLAAIYTQEGETAEVGAVVCTIVENKEDVGKVFTSGAAAPAVAAVPSVPAQAVAATQQAAAAPSGPKPGFEALMMPALSSTMKEGKIVSWGKKIGDKVKPGHQTSLWKLMISASI